MQSIFQGLGTRSSINSGLGVGARFSDADAAWIANGGFKQHEPQALPCADDRSIFIL